VKQATNSWFDAERGGVGACCEVGRGHCGACHNCCPKTARALGYDAQHANPELSALFPCGPWGDLGNEGENVDEDLLDMLLDLDGRTQRALDHTVY